jgi:hypothetical protein
MKTTKIAAGLLAVTFCAAAQGPLSEGYAADVTGQADAAGALTRFETVTLERTACEGTCPMYRVVIHGDGRVEYDGYRFVKVRSATTTLSQEHIQALLTAINRARYFSLRNSYRSREDGCPTYAIDLPSALTSVTSSGVTRKIRHDLGCRELPAPDGRLGAPYPRELTAFETAIDEIVNTARWAKR